MGSDDGEFIFGDVGLEGVGPPGGIQAWDPDVMLQREFVGMKERFQLRLPITFEHPATNRSVTVPHDQDFRTDLTSVPAVLTWLVPKTGRHLPAAILHDGMVLDRVQIERGARDYDVTPLDPAKVPKDTGSDAYRYFFEIPRTDADLIFRAAMRKTGTGSIRRWIVWSAVTLATMWSGSQQWNNFWRAYFWLVMVVTVVACVALGLANTAGLLGSSVPGIGTLPWMTGDTWWRDLLGAASASIAVPAVVGVLLWGRLRAAGLIAGVLLALLWQVTLVVGLLTALYLLVERLAQVAPRPMQLLAALVVVGACIVTLVTAVG